MSLSRKRENKGARDAGLEVEGKVFLDFGR
jgi:hypothetical protein